MRAYFLRRLLLIPPTLIGVTFIVFLMTRFVPGGPVEQMMTQMRKASARAEDAADRRWKAGALGGPDRATQGVLQSG